MSRKLLVTDLRRAKKTAQGLVRAKSADATAAAAAVGQINAALESLGESTNDHIAVSQTVPLAGSAPAPAKAHRFNRTPPNLYGPQTAAIEAEQVTAVEKKSAVVAEPVVQDEPTPRATPPAPPVDNLDAAAASGMISEEDHSEATLKRIASSSHKSILEQFGTPEAIQQFTRLIGGEPNPDKTNNQQAAILKKAAAAALKSK